MKEKYKIITLFFSLSMLLTINCKPQHSNEEHDSIMTFGIPMLLLQQEDYVLSDNLNGTVNLDVKNGFGVIGKSFIYKKCLQGQVYRQTQNDCQGAGTLSNLWNASLLQYCSTNDNVCNPTGQFVTGSNAYVYGANSQIYVSCDKDITAGLKWYPGNGDGKLGYLVANAMLKSIYPDLPWNDSIGIWSAISYSDNSKADFYIIPFPYNPNAFAIALKTSLKYVLCGTTIPK